MQTYEVEIKTLLGSAERAEAIRASLKKIDPSCSLVSKNSQLNHYFQGNSLETLFEHVSHRLTPEARARLQELAQKARDFSVRTRRAIKEDSDAVYLVVKASVGSDSSANGVARMEFEEELAMTLDELDNLLLSAGFTCQAKWSREREEYVVQGITVTLDKNAGYGWLAEFERVLKSASEVAAARGQIQSLMQQLGVQELPQERLERMFAYYNAHWPEYYGTDKIFNIE